MPPQSGRPPNERIKYFEETADLLKEAERYKKLVILGDMNARLHARREGEDDVRHLRAKALAVFAATNQVNEDLGEEERARLQKARSKLKSMTKSSFVSKSRKSFRSMASGRSSKQIAVDKQAALECWDDPCACCPWTTRRHMR